MTRKEKIRLLQAVEEGKLKPEDIRELQIYTFFKKEGGWEHNGKLISEAEYLFLKKQIEESSLRRWALGLGEDIIAICDHET